MNRVKSKTNKIPINIISIKPKINNVNQRNKTLINSTGVTLSSNSKSKGKSKENILNQKSLVEENWKKNQTTTTDQTEVMETEIFSNKEEQLKNNPENKNNLPQKTVNAINNLLYEPNGTNQIKVVARFRPMNSFEEVTYILSIGN